MFKQRTADTSVPKSQAFILQYHCDPCALVTRLLPGWHDAGCSGLTLVVYPDVFGARSKVWFNNIFVGPLTIHHSEQVLPEARPKMKGSFLAAPHVGIPAASFFPIGNAPCDTPFTHPMSPHFVGKIQVLTLRHGTHTRTYSRSLRRDQEVWQLFCSFFL